MNNNKNPKDLILATDTMKNHRHNGSGTIKTECKTPKHENSKKPSKSEEK